MARGSNSSARSVCSQARMLPINSSASRDSDRGARLICAASAGPAAGTVKLAFWPICLTRAIRHKNVANAPNGLNIARRGGIDFHQFAQTRDLHVEAAIKRLELAATRQLGKLLA